MPDSTALRLPDLPPSDLLDPDGFEDPCFLVVDHLHFAGVQAVPEVQALEDGQVLTYRFENGYGAVVARQDHRPALSAFEFCVLDCTVPAFRPTFETPLAPEFLAGLSHAAVTELLHRAQALPAHPALRAANAVLHVESF